MSTNRLPVPGVQPGVYRHFEGGVYTVTNTARLESSPDRVYVNYRGEDGRYWIRPLEDFTDYTMNNHGVLVRRFERLDAEEALNEGPSIMQRLWDEAHRTGQALEASQIPILFQKLHPAAKMPTHGQQGDAGVDFYALGVHTVPARSRVRIPTGIALAIPAGHYGHMQSRSGLSLKHGIEVGAGTIDSGYRGEVSILLYNHSDTDYIVQHEDRISQMVVDTFRRQIYEEVPVLPDSDRTDGWGSTGR